MTSYVPDAPDPGEIPDLSSFLDFPSSQWMPLQSQDQTQNENVTNSSQRPRKGQFDRLFWSGENSTVGSLGNANENSQDIFVESSPSPKTQPALKSSHGRKGLSSNYFTSPAVFKSGSKKVAPLRQRDTDTSMIPSPQHNGHPGQRVIVGPYGDGQRSKNSSKLGERQGNDALYTPAPLVVPGANNREQMKLRPVAEISEEFRTIFTFPYFNIVQSKIMDDVLYTDNHLVICAPTGSGKTVAFELAIIRLLTSFNKNYNRKFKIVYMAPIKALCSERYNDWQGKFAKFGLKCKELTGDTEMDDFYELQEVHIILTTPEKWDSMTRRWRDNRSIMDCICLFLIDEIHILSDTCRGPTVEAVVSRMKTIQAARSRSNNSESADRLLPLRFLAVSATITNIEDIAEWLGTEEEPAVTFKIDESARPVRLRKVVLGYYFTENKTSEFQFDMTLNYKLSAVIATYSEGKPSLIFCSTRKGAQQGAEIIAKEIRTSYIHGSEQRNTLFSLSHHLKDSKLRDLVMKGVAYHHAGMDQQDRKKIEEVFLSGSLPVLVATSTLAMGVNLPAHLVVVKHTMFYNLGAHQEYPDTQVLQMIGRAGRPQFDTSATAVIMTKNQSKAKYENLLHGTQLIESSLHKNLTEHLNAEIVLNTITDVSVAVEWLRYTFLYIRVMKNPKHYGMPVGLSREQIEKILQDMCMKNLNELTNLKMIVMDEETLDIKPTDGGRLMARYCLSYKTMRLFLTITGLEAVSDLVTLMSNCEEFADIILRNNEKKTLNTLNKDKHKATIRYPMQGKMKSADMKVSCLIQAQLGCLTVQDFSLQQDMGRIFRIGCRVTRCLVEILWPKLDYKSLLSAVLLCKNFRAKLWDDSKFVCRQLDGIGPSLSTALVNAGMISFEKVEETNPREIELIVNRHPPFGNQVREAVSHLPKYELVIEQLTRYSSNSSEILITIQLSNHEDLKSRQYNNHTCTLLVGNTDNVVVFKQRFMDCQLLKSQTWSRKLDIKLASQGPELYVHYISQDWVGLDVECVYTPNYLGGVRVSNSSVQHGATVPEKSAPNCPPQENPPSSCSTPRITVPCNHSCHNKRMCAHECCKTGVAVKRKPSQKATPKSTLVRRPCETFSKPVTQHMDEIKKRVASFPQLPSSVKRSRIQMHGTEDSRFNLEKFAFTPRKSALTPLRSVPSTPASWKSIEQTPGDPSYSHSSSSGYVSGQNPSTTGQQVSVDSNRRWSPDIPDHNRACEPQSTSLTTPSLRPGWEELDMFIKHRQQCIKDEEEAYVTMETESLPDLDEGDAVLVDVHLAREPYKDIGNQTYDLSSFHEQRQPLYTANIPDNLSVDQANQTGSSLRYGTQHQSMYTGLEQSDTTFHKFDGSSFVNDDLRDVGVDADIDTGNDFISADHADLYVKVNAEGESRSKWSGYFNSQSSTNSDYLTKQFPSRQSGDGSLCIQKCNSAAQRYGTMSHNNTLSRQEDGRFVRTQNVSKPAVENVFNNPYSSIGNQLASTKHTQNYNQFLQHQDNIHQPEERFEYVCPDTTDGNDIQRSRVRRDCQLGQLPRQSVLSETGQTRKQVQTHKYGQVLAWVSSSQGMSDQGQTDQNYDYWEDEEEATCAPGNFDMGNIDTICISDDTLSDDLTCNKSMIRENNQKSQFLQVPEDFQETDIRDQNNSPTSSRPKDCQLGPQSNSSVRPINSNTIATRPGKQQPFQRRSFSSFFQ